MSMLHVTVHFALGVLVGTVLTAPPFLRAFAQRAPTAPAAGRMILGGYLFGILAVTPNILLNLGLPADFCTGWWMNIFLLHPALDRLRHGAQLPGQILLVLAFIAQYAILLACLHRRGAPLRP